MEVRLVKTGDGSDTLFVPELNEHYHSTFGAINESKHIFIDAGFKQITDNQQDCRILEIGFGTGLNAFLTLIEARKKQVNVHYTSIEAFPLPGNIIKQLNYPDLLDPSEAGLFILLHNRAWGKEEKITGSLTLLKIKDKLENCDFPTGYFDLVYFDAFGPEVQPELWTSEIFCKIFNSTVPGGILVTYSSKGSIRRSLKNAGFSVEKLPGPTGKREITRATKPFADSRFPVSNH